MNDGVVIDELRNTISIRRTYAANVDRAWWAWTDAEAIAKWWGPAGWTATVYEMDVRPGGRWRFEIASEDGSADPIRGVATYGVVNVRTKLTYEDAFADETWQPDGTGTFPTSVTFSPARPGCCVEVEAMFPNNHALQRAVEHQMANGYAETLERLNEFFESTQRRHDHANH